MLLNSYTLEFVRLACGSEAQPVDLRAYLNQDISEVIPYLNAVLGGFQYTKDPRSVSFKLHGKLVVIHPREICVNAPSDQSEGEKIIEWLKEKSTIPGSAGEKFSLVSKVLQNQRCSKS